MFVNCSLRTSATTSALSTTVATSGSTFLSDEATNVTVNNTPLKALTDTESPESYIAEPVLLRHSLTATKHSNALSMASGNLISHTEGNWHVNAKLENNS